MVSLSLNCTVIVVEGSVFESPVCSREVLEKDINAHLDNDCKDVVPTKPAGSLIIKSNQKSKPAMAPIFGGPTKKNPLPSSTPARSTQASSSSNIFAQKRRATEDALLNDDPGPSKRSKTGSTTSAKLSSAAPLPERLRPQSLEEFVGQPHLTAPDSLLMGLIRKGSTGSMIFWGPPGCVITLHSRTV